MGAQRAAAARPRAAGSRSTITTTPPIRSCMSAVPVLPGGCCRWAFCPGGYFARWHDADVTKAVHDALHGKLQVAEGRDAKPSARVIDSQSEERSPSNAVRHQQEDQRGEAVRCLRHTRSADSHGLHSPRGRPPGWAAQPAQLLPQPARSGLPHGTPSPTAGSPASSSTGRTPCCRSPSRWWASPPASAASPSPAAGRSGSRHTPG